MNKRPEVSARAASGLPATPPKNRRIPALLALAALLLAAQSRAAAPAYDPLALPAGFSPQTTNLAVQDAQRNRDIPIRVYLPAQTRAAPVVLFSHGLGGSREGSVFLGAHWAARGYVAVFLQHPGSDTTVWQGRPLNRRMDAMQQAAGPANFMLRVKDVPAVLDQLERWNTTAGHPLAGRLDLKRVGMSGHSFGAITTQALSGQAFGAASLSFADARIQAAIALSPSSPRLGSPQQAFGRVKIPWLLMTGTEDISRIGEADLKSRRAVFPALPPGGKYELVLEGAEHSAFADRALPGDTLKRNPNHHRVILALSTAFWDACLRQDPDAKAWLDGAGPRSVLAPGDQWQTK